MKIGRPDLPSAGLARLVLAVLLLLAFAALEAASHSGAGEPRSWGDSPVYFEQAEMPLFGLEFFHYLKPPTTPAFYKLVRSDPALITRAQSAISVVCWFVLGLVLASCLRTLTLQVVVLASVCLLSLAIPVNQWDWILFSESLSLSLLALVVALSVVWVRLVGERRPGRVPVTLAWAAACLLLGFTRDSNIYLLATLWGCVALWWGIDVVLRHRQGDRRRVDATLLLGLVLLGLTVFLAQAGLQSSRRWHTPFLNVLLRRVLRKPMMQEAFVERYGLPSNPTFEAYAGKKAWTESRLGPPMRVRLFWSDDPAVADVRQWILERGPSSYARYLLLDQPLDSLRASFDAFAEHAWSRQPERKYGRRAGRTPFTEHLTRWAWARPRSPILLWALTLIAGAVVAVGSPRCRVLGLATVFLTLNALIQAFVAFHGDTTAVPRHMVGSAVVFRLAILLFVAAAIDEVSGRLGRTSRG